MIGVLATPLMAIIMPAHKVVGLLLPIMILADVFAVISHWQRWDKKLVLLLTPGAVVGTILASLLITNISPLLLRRSIGLIALLFILYKLFEKRLTNAAAYTPHWWHGWLAGSAAGFSSTLAHTGGPPVVIYLLLQKISPRVFVATAALYFAIINWIKVPSYLYIGLFDFELLRQVVWLLPVLPFGVWVGKLIADKVNKVIFDRIMMLLLGVSALFLLFR